jgi:hypothetical protein
MRLRLLMWPGLINLINLNNLNKKNAMMINKLEKNLTTIKW